MDILNIGKLNNTPNGKLIRTVMLAFAEFEKDMIVERTQGAQNPSPGFALLFYKHHFAVPIRRTS